MKKEKKDEKKEQGQPKQEGFVARVFILFNQYDKIIYGVAIGLLLIVCALLAFNKFYLVPQSEKASALMTAPIDYMMRGDSLSFVQALEGDDENEGFLSIASSFSLTKTANTANYFAAKCYLGLGDKEEALNYFLKYKHKEDIFWYAAQAMISDIYDDQGDINMAIKYAEKAAKTKDVYTAPAYLFKLGQLYEREENWAKAAEAYLTIKEDLYAEFQKTGVEKYLERALLKKDQ
jgi:tetratricopeptide (TPR) repeat protein